MWNPFKNSPSQEKLETRDLASPDAWLLEVFNAQGTSSGVTVTPQTAMRSTAVRAAVQAISEAIGQLPVHVFERTEDGAKQRNREHSVSKLLNSAANPWTAASEFREQITRDALLHGNGLIYVNRANGVPREFIRLSPDTVEIECHAATGEPVYKVKQPDNTQRSYSSNDIIHLKAPSLNGVIGESPVMSCKEAIGLSIVLEMQATNLFANGARPGGVIEVPGKLGDDGLKKMKAGWKAAHGGSSNTGKTAILWDGATFSPNTLNSVDAQFLEMRRFAVEEISRVFRVPPHLLFEMGRATWGNAAEMSASFVRFGLMRWIKQWEGELNLKLFAEDNIFAEFLLDDFLRSDIDARADAYSKLIASRVLSPNEARALENRPPYEGGDTFENPNTSTAPSGNEEV